MFTPSSAYETGKGRERELERRIQRQEQLAEAAKGRDTGGDHLISTLIKKFGGLLAGLRGSGRAARAEADVRDRERQPLPG